MASRYRIKSAAALGSAHLLLPISRSLYSECLALTTDNVSARPIRQANMIYNKRSIFCHLCIEHFCRISLLQCSDYRVTSGPIEWIRFSQHTSHANASQNVVVAACTQREQREADRQDTSGAVHGHDQPVQGAVQHTAPRHGTSDLTGERRTPHQRENTAT